MVLELDGGASARGMAELASTLMQRPFVARATPRRQGRDKAVIDLVVRGTDGVGVALALDEGAWGELGLVVVEASEGKVVARAR